MCTGSVEKPEKASEAFVDPRSLFPDPDRRSWEQYFSKRHQEICSTWQPEHPDGEILRVFSRVNFSRLSHDKALKRPCHTWLDPKDTIPEWWYERIRPALVLATRLIKDASLFFNILVFGKVHHIETGDLLYNVEEASRLKLQFPEMFDNLNNIQFFTGHSSKNREDAYAQASVAVHPLGEENEMAAAYVQLNTKFITFFTHYHYEEFSEDVKNRLLINLAVTLVHELVHVWYGHKVWDYARQGQVPLWKFLKFRNEPYFYGDEANPELGHSWERFAFNGVPRLSCAGGPFAEASHLVMDDWVEGEQESESITVIDPRLAGALLDKDCWDTYDRLCSELPTYKSVMGENLIQKMEMVVALRMVQKATGRLPTPNQLAMELVGAKLMERRSIGRKSLPAELPQTPPQTPPCEEEDKEEELGEAPSSATEPVISPEEMLANSIRTGDWREYTLRTYAALHQQVKLDPKHIKGRAATTERLYGGRRGGQGGGRHSKRGRY